MSTQDEIFLSEGDNWFRRNDYTSSDVYEVLEYLKSNADFLPNKILDIGCSDGSKLNEICNFYLSKNLKTEGCGIEPSKVAIEEGTKRFPNLNLNMGFSHDLDMYTDNHFDLVILSFVFHWVDRTKLFKTFSEIDRVLKNGGRLIIQDFAPPFHCKVKYHHLPDQEVYTYKQFYWETFTASQLYSLLFLKEFQHNKKNVLDNQNLSKIAVLEKRIDENYVLT